MPCPALLGDAEQRRLDVIIARQSRDVGEPPRIEPRDPRPGEPAADSFVIGRRAAGIEHEQRIAALRGEGRERRIGGDQPVGQRDDPRERMEPRARLARAAHGVDAHPAPPDPRDRAEQFGGQPRYDDHQLRRPGGRQQPRLIFDHRHAGERQCRRQHSLAVFGILNGEQQSREHPRAVSG